MRPLLISLPEIVLSMDRTVLGKSAGIHVNILTVAISYKGRACPVYWKVFDRKGNSSFEDWKEVLTNLFQKKVGQKHPTFGRIYRGIAADGVAFWHTNPCCC